jgi:GTPase
VDGCPDEVLKHTREQVANLIKTPEVGKAHFAIRSEKDIDIVVDKLHGLVPILSVSCVTGDGLDLLRKLFVSLPKRRRHMVRTHSDEFQPNGSLRETDSLLKLQNKINRPFEFLIEEIFNVRGIGSVVSGFVNAGQWKKGEVVHIGPMSDGTYVETVVKSVHVERNETNHVWAGHSACFALGLSKESRKWLRKGMVLLKEPVPASRSFSANVCILKGDGTTITKGRYQTVVHVLHVRQTALVVDFKALGHEHISDSNSVLRPGSRATIQFQFLHRPVRKTHL